MSRIDRSDWSEGKLHRFHCWLDRVDEWRNKFTNPLTRGQAVEVILDECDWDEASGEMIGGTIKFVCEAVEWQDFGYSYKYHEEK